jgi:hypothetical protein
MSECVCVWGGGVVDRCGPDGDSIQTSLSTCDSIKRSFSKMRSRNFHKNTLSSGHQN